MPQTRKIFIGGNWKMNKTRAEAEEFFRIFLPLVREINDIDIHIFPPFTLLNPCVGLLSAGSVRIGGQNLYFKDSGAFTGDISGGMLRDVGCHSVLVGHSERRHVFGEPDEVMAPKVQAALSSDLLTVYCVGEKLEEREAGKTEEVLKRQLLSGLDRVTPEQTSNLVIAYEPVWAIGTGKNATTEDAQKVCGSVRTLLRNRFENDTAEKLRILYGGSVSVSNFLDYLKAPDIDGLLIGGASLNAENLAKICKFDRAGI